MAELASVISHLMYDNCSELPSTETEVTSSPSLPALYNYAAVYTKLTHQGSTDLCLNPGLVLRSYMKVLDTPP